METIASSAEISALFDKGRWYKSPFITFIVAPLSKKTEDDPAREHDLKGRVAFIAGKKLGGAVWRNAAKRRMRAVCRDVGGPWAGYEVIFLAKSGLLDTSYHEVLERSKKKIREFVDYQ